MEKSPDFINNVLLKDVETKWLMSNFRTRQDMKLFCDGYLFAIHDFYYGNDEINEKQLPKSLENVKNKSDDTLRVGFIGLIDKSWIETSSLDINDYKLEKTVRIGKELSETLKIFYNCDMVIAITHLTNNEDMNLQNNETSIDMRNKLIYRTWRT